MEEGNLRLIEDTLVLKRGANQRVRLCRHPKLRGEDKTIKSPCHLLQFVGTDPQQQILRDHCLKWITSGLRRVYGENSNLVELHTFAPE